MSVNFTVSLKHQKTLYILPYLAQIFKLYIISLMEYTFSLGWFAAGVAILLIGTALTLYYKPVADNLGGGASSYDRYRLYGLITCAIGLAVMVNLHTLLFSLFFGILFGGLNN